MAEKRIIGFGSDTLILSGRGYIPAAEISPGDSVMGRDGGFHIVTRTAKADGHLYHVEATSSAGLDLSGSAKLLVRLKDKYLSAGEKASYRYISVAELAKMHDEDLPEYKRYLVGVPISGKPSYPEWGGVYIDRGIGPKHEKRIDVTDPSLWYLVGAYLKAGNLVKNYRAKGTRLPYEGIHVIKPIGWDESILQLLPSTLNVNVVRNSSKNTDTLYIGGCELASFMKDFGARFKDKIVPGSVFLLPPDFCRYLITGFMGKADVNLDEYRVPKKSCRITISNKRVALSLAHILMRGFGISCHFNTAKVCTTRTINGRTFTMGDFYYVDFSLVNVNKIQSFIEDGIMWYPIKSITEMEKGKVISITAGEGGAVVASEMVVLP